MPDEPSTTAKLEALIMEMPRGEAEELKINGVDGEDSLHSSVATDTFTSQIASRSVKTPRRRKIRRNSRANITCGDSTQSTQRRNRSFRGNPPKIFQTRLGFLLFRNLAYGVGPSLEWLPHTQGGGEWLLRSLSSAEARDLQEADSRAKAKGIRQRGGRDVLWVWNHSWRWWCKDG